MNDSASPSGVRIEATPLAHGRGSVRTAHRRVRNRAAVTGLVVAAAFGVITDIAPAQAPRVYRAASAMDLYGNARPTAPERRELDIYQNPAQRLALRGYQALQRRENQRGGVTPFGLLADTYARRRAESSTLPIFDQPFQATPYVLSMVPERAYRAYGGFTERVGGIRRGDAAEAFERRRALIAATSLNAPVHRANLSLSLAAGVAAAVGRTPFVPREPNDPRGISTTLDEQLHERVRLSHERMRSDGWSWFHDGAYRRAARAFESASLLDPDDDASRVGELFSHISLGAGNTAVAVMKQLNEHAANPFAIDVNLIDRFDQPQRASELRIRTQPAGAEESADLTAIHVMVLWYLGDRDEAQRVAARLARANRDSPYATWPALMRDARHGASPTVTSPD
jgi:hypothetical protein